MAKSTIMTEDTTRGLLATIAMLEGLFDEQRKATPDTKNGLFCERMDGKSVCYSDNAELSQRINKTIIDFKIEKATGEMT